MFERKCDVYHNEALPGLHSMSKLLAVFESIRLGWKCLRNALAYVIVLPITIFKSFTVQATCLQGRQLWRKNQLA